MIQAILTAIVATWLAWGALNVIWGVAQICLGIICGIVSAILYAVAITLETIGRVLTFLRLG